MHLKKVEYHQNVDLILFRKVHYAETNRYQVFIYLHFDDYGIQLSWKNPNSLSPKFWNIFLKFSIAAF